MNVFSAIYCRLYQTVLKAFSPFLPYREPKMLKDYDSLIPVLNRHQKRKIFIITYPSERSFKLMNELLTTLTTYGFEYTIFNGVKPNPTNQNVEDALEMYHANNCDTIIAFGGGSPIDCAKAVAARVACPTKSLNQMKGILRVNHKLKLLIAIPTTAGSGSETTLSAVITDEKADYKYIINDFDLIPHYTLLDPKLTAGVPSQLTATSGMDALCHAVEAYIGKATTRKTRKYSLRAIKLIFENIENAYQDGSNLEARRQMLRASHLAGKAFTRSYVGYVHAVSHTLGGKYKVPHGVANAVILPYMLKMYGKSIYKKLYQIGEFADLFDETMPLEMGAKLVIKKIEELNKALNIPTRIKEIKEEDILAMSKKACKEANPLYPVPKLFSKKQLANVYYMIKE